MTVYLRMKPDLLPVGKVVKCLHDRLSGHELLIVVDCFVKISLKLGKKCRSEGDGQRSRRDFGIVTMDPA